MLKENKKQLIISSIITLVPMLVGLILWNTLPDTMATHWGSNGEANGWSSKTFSVFGLPLMMLVIHWVCIFATLKDPKNKGQSRKVFGMVLWIIPIVSLLMTSMTYAIALEMDIRIDMVVRLLLGVIFVIMGNYLPKCKQNYTIGIKVIWALRNEENWNKTHRFAGRVWVLGGVLLLATIFIPMESFVGVLIAVILVLAFMPMIYSYLFYRKQLNAGTITKEEIKATSREKAWSKVSMVVGIVILVMATFFITTGKIEVSFQDEMLSIEANYWDDMKIFYDVIDTVEYRTEDNPGSRTFGYGSLQAMMGNFENSEFGRYTRYSYTTCDACVVITSDDKVLVVNGKDEAQTLEIYNELMKRIEK